jgi:hypothetical protein
MTEKDEIVVHGFVIRKWHPLTELPQTDSGGTDGCAAAGNIGIIGKVIGETAMPSPAIDGLNPNLIKLLWDMLVFPYSTITVRIRRGAVTSARAFEQAKHEGIERGLIIESAAGAAVYLIPTVAAYKLFNMPCPFDERNVSIQHSYYRGLAAFLLGKDPANKSVHQEMKLGQKGHTIDVLTVDHNSARTAYEVTLSTNNVLSNIQKYQAISDSIARIVLVCRDYRLKEACKSLCRESGLNPDLLAKLDYMHFSQLLQRQRKLSLY